MGKIHTDQISKMVELKSFALDLQNYALHYFKWKRRKEARMKKEEEAEKLKNEAAMKKGILPDFALSGGKRDLVSAGAN